MTPELTYFLKVNVAIALFYAFYRLFFHKDTFFRWRRIALLCFFLISMLYPLLNIQEWIKSNEPMVAIADLYTTSILPESSIAIPQETDTNRQEQLTLILTLFYWTGVGVLTIRFLIQLSSIIRLHFQCGKSKMYGAYIHLLKKGHGPFSFFNWIFLCPEAHTESEISEIITHEQTHARQYHSADVLISEIMCIACWFNPFVWLMKCEIRSNLEYMADHQVLETGHDSKSYQYHLLALSHHKTTANLSNSFNVLPLKNRIKMMNRKRTKRIGKTKYLMFLPLAALLMIISNIEMVARTAQEFTKDMAGQEAPQPAGQFEESSPLLSPTELPSATNPQNGEKAITKDTVNPEEDIFMLVEEMPVFPGGKGAFLQYLNENIRYPEDARQQKIEGQEIVKFIVKKDGSIANPEIVRSLSPSLDTEAIRLITSMPKWIPGKQRGQAVNVVVHAPINFQLKKKEAPKAEEIQQSDMQGIVVVGYGSSKSTQEDPAVKTADKMPAFPGGKEALFRYLAQNIKYPTIAQENKEQGVVNVKMIIGKDGSISKVQVVNSPSPALGIEAIRVVNKMPKWIPGEVNGKPVNVEYTFPITFRLQ